MKKNQKSNDESGIRTHAPEETRSLVWRLRPLGHLAFRSESSHWIDRDSEVVWDSFNRNETLNYDRVPSRACTYSLVVSLMALG